MTDHISTLNFRRGAGNAPFPVMPGLQRMRTGLARDWQKYVHVLGPHPKRSLETFVDLGLDDPEIGRYFKIPSEIVTRLRQIWRIERSG